MNIRKSFIPVMILFLSGMCLSCETTGKKESCSKEPVDYVNPYIGNISHLLMPTYPTVQLPNSMLRVYPRRENYATDLIAGLPVIVPSHRGLSVFRIDPVNQTENGDEVLKGHSYHNEQVTPYRYSVDLDEEEIHVDFAPSHQSAVYKLLFDKGNAHLVLTSGNGELEITNEGIQGYHAINQFTKVYLYLETGQKPVKTEIRQTDNRQKGWVDATVSFGGELLTSAVLSFDVSEIDIRYGVSFISVEQAKKNLRREIPGYDIEALASAGRAEWNNALGKIQVEGCDENAKTVVYTALYRTCERMINFSEDGHYYSGMDHQVHSDEGTPFYTDDWIWDTYRATHPLRVIIEPEI
jgi:predicted alpha-1,2-mannosidase